MLIPFVNLRKELDILGIIHVGAHTAEEKNDYKPLPVKWIEADPELFDKLTVANKHWFAATNFNGEVEFNICGFKASNSLLKPKRNLTWNPRAKVESVITVPARRIDTIQEPGYNFINLDIQGAELNALKGTDLSLIDYIYTEVHEAETYVDCTQMSELDEYLVDFERVQTKMLPNKWGDALYVRRGD